MGELTESRPGNQSDKQLSSSNIAPQHPIEINEVPIESPVVWLYDGFSDFKAHLMSSIIYGLVFFTIYQQMLIYLGSEPFYLLALITGFLLFGPFLALGLYDLSLRKEQGEPVSFWHSTIAWHRNIFSLVIQGVLLALVMGLWTLLSVALAKGYYPEISTLGGLTLDSLVGYLLGTPQFLEFLAVYVLMGLVFATVVFVMTVISFPMLLDRDVGCLNATMTSLQCVLKNKLVMAMWGLFVMSLIAVGFASYGVALIFLVPILGHASWYAYRSLITKH